MTAATILEVTPAGWLDREAAAWADDARDALAPLPAEDDKWAWGCNTDPDMDRVSEPGSAVAGLLAHACALLCAHHGDRLSVAVDAEETR